MRQQDGVLFVSGPLTHAQASAALAEGAEAIAAGCRVVDLAEVGQVDSVAVSLLLAWQRRAQKQGEALRFRHLPDSVTSLIALYGVESLIPT